MKRVAIVQSNYIPWKGYFDLIASVDEFILFDDVQYTRRDWRNRNQIKTPQGPSWLSVPVKVKGKFEVPINEVEIDGDAWVDEHINALQRNYARAPHFAAYGSAFADLLRGARFPLLGELNLSLIKWVCGQLAIQTLISSSHEYRLVDGKSERLAELCAQSGATEYVSGPAAKAYLDEGVFASRGIRVSWFDYSGYPEYPQLWGEFIHAVSVLDLLFNCGPQAGKYMKFVPKQG